MEELGNGSRVTRLIFGDCYKAFRQIMLGFVPNLVETVRGIAHFLAVGDREGWQANGVSAFDIYTATISPRQLSRLKKEMAAHRPSVHKIDWVQLLPVDGPPPVVELDNLEGMQ
jgi:hypothetical protein